MSGNLSRIVENGTLTNTVDINIISSVVGEITNSLTGNDTIQENEVSFYVFRY